MGEKLCSLALRGAEEKVQRERFLRRKRFLRLTGPFGPEGS